MDFRICLQTAARHGVLIALSLWLGVGSSFGETLPLPAAPSLQSIRPLPDEWVGPLPDAEPGAPPPAIREVTPAPAAVTPADTPPMTPSPSEGPAQAGKDKLLPLPESQQPAMFMTYQRSRTRINRIFQFDHTPLGKRMPVILVPGRAEEFQRNSWWRGMHDDAKKNPYFSRYFKLYCYIYDSTQEVDEQSELYKAEVKRHFGHLPKSQPLMMVVYSLGGVIAREAFADEALLKQTDTVIAIAVPFHGSPLFDPDWFAKFMRPPNRSPIRRTWDQLIYRGYMFNKSNLTRGLRWDNFDSSKPQFEPNKVDIAGDQIIPHMDVYQEYARADEMKRKMIIYASYMENGYTQGNNQPLNPAKLPFYVIDKTAALPGEIVASVLPFYGFTVHSVFTYMNNQLSNIPSYTPEDPQGKNTHLYKYNDGAIPLSSMLFLPPSKEPYSMELNEMLAKSTTRKNRIFVNIDHMHVGEYTMVKPKLVRQDVVHPEEGRRSPNKWIIRDLLNRVEFELPDRPAVLTHDDRDRQDEGEIREPASAK